MTFKHHGRTKGAKDKYPRAGSMDFNLLRHFLNGEGMQTVIEEVRGLSGMQYVNAYCKILEYVAPKMSKEEKAITVSFDLTALHNQLANTSPEDVKAGVLDITSEKRLQQAEIKADSILEAQLLER